MRLIYDTVSGHELQTDGQTGRIIRTGLGIAEDGDLPEGSTPTRAMATDLHSLLPFYGTSYGVAGYLDFLLMRKTVRAITASTLAFVLEYRNLSAMTFQDHTTLQQVPTQLHPTGVPLEVPFASGGQADGRTLTLSYALPLRSLTVTSAQVYAAANDLVSCVGCVNDDVWQGKPRGFWLLTAFTAETPDLGVTIVYSATWSTKQREDWSQYGFLKDAFGQNVKVNPGDIATLRSRPYQFDVVNVPGVLKTGLYPVADFFTIFGI